MEECMSKEEQMRALFEQWRASGKPRATFAREHEIPVNSFHYWCQRFEGKRVASGYRRTRVDAPPPSGPSFVEVARASPPSPHPRPRLRFDLPDGTSITVY
jgi:hypothetical protein